MRTNSIRRGRNGFNSVSLKPAFSLESSGALFLLFHFKVHVIASKPARSVSGEVAVIKCTDKVGDDSGLSTE